MQAVLKILCTFHEQTLALERDPIIHLNSLNIYDTLVTLNWLCHSISSHSPFNVQAVHTKFQYVPVQLPQGFFRKKSPNICFRGKQLAFIGVALSFYS